MPLPAAFDPEVHARRRDRLVQALREAGGGVALLPTATVQRRSADDDYPYRFDSDFHYLTGFDEPEAWLLVSSSGSASLFCRVRDPERELWDGVRLGPEAVPATLGIAVAHPIDAFEATVPDLLLGAPSLWLPFGAQAGLLERAQGWIATAERRHARTDPDLPRALRDLRPLLAEMRLVKDASELATMRRAAEISAGAHRRAMRFVAARLTAEPQARIPEYAIEAELLHEFRRHGAQSPAYPSIVAAGRNACVLHHAAGPATLAAGELCLIDAGCELDGYASDITRTFPASGRFTPEQRALYDIVVAAQTAAIDATRPGRRRIDAHWAAVRVIAEGLLDVGLLARSRDGDADAVIESGAYRRFYMHGTGHWLGRDVHDVGDYASRGEPPEEQRDGQGGRVVRRPSRRLEPGMVLTLEPGVYVRPGDGVPERFWHIGIRIEDDAVVTPAGCELISRGVPVEAAAIESLMAAARPDGAPR